MPAIDVLRVAPGGCLGGQVRVPGDKSISHRAVMLGAIAEGVTEVHGCLLSEDVRATMTAFRAMGVRIDERPSGEVRVHGKGLYGLQSPAGPLDLGNSGTSARLLTGILAGTGISATLTGDASLRGRPMRRVTEPLAAMGARLSTDEHGRPPITLAGGGRLSAIDYTLPIASAQVKSAILLAGLYATGHTCVTEPAPTRDHTERMLAGFGVTVERDGLRRCVGGGQRLSATPIDVPADISSAAFFIVGAAIVEGSRLLLRNVGVNPTRTGVIEILRIMGAEIDLANQREIGGEPIADITVRGAPLRGIAIPRALVPSAIDEFPAIFIAAACAQGETTLRGAGELRFKESDRIDVMARGLAHLQVGTTTWEDGIRITGGEIGGGTVDSHHDHRVAMAFAIAGLRASAPITILGSAPIATSFPEFAEIALGAGLKLLEQ